MGSKSSQVKLLLPKFHRNRTRKYNNTALFGGGCWVSLTGCFHRHSAAGWAECTVTGPGRVRRHAAQFSERSSTPLIGHARVALSGVITRVIPSTQTDDTQRGEKGYPSMAYQRSRRSLKELSGVTVDPSRAGDCTPSPAGKPNAGGNAQSKRPSSRPRRARCCYIGGFCF